MMDQNINLAVTSAQCLRETSNIGSTVVHNICNGQAHTIPWGTADWAGMSFVAILGTSFVGFAVFALGALIWSAIPRYRDY